MQMKYYVIVLTLLSQLVVILLGNCLLFLYSCRSIYGPNAELDSGMFFMGALMIFYFVFGIYLKKLAPLLTD